MKAIVLVGVSGSGKNTLFSETDLPMVKFSSSIEHELDSFRSSGLELVAASGVRGLSDCDFLFNYFGKENVKFIHITRPGTVGFAPDILNYLGTYLTVHNTGNVEQFKKVGQRLKDGVFKMTEYRFKN